MTFLGLDPGKNGGIAWIRDGNPCAEKMPETDKDILDLLRGIVREEALGMTFALIERVASSPQMGVVSAFTFGKGYGGLQMALLACDIPFEFVTPSVWQKAMGCLTKGDKNVSKAAAQRIFPTLKINHAIADSLLIAEHAKRSMK